MTLLRFHDLPTFSAIAAADILFSTFSFFFRAAIFAESLRFFFARGFSPFAELQAARFLHYFFSRQAIFFPAIAVSAISILFFFETADVAITPFRVFGIRFLHAVFLYIFQSFHFQTFSAAARRKGKRGSGAQARECEVRRALKREGRGSALASASAASYAKGGID